MGAAAPSRPGLDPATADALVTAAREARARAYAPYSRFLVGAAGLFGSGTVRTGANVENSSYGLTICAERVAITAAVADGERSLAAIAVCAEPLGGGTVPVPPCGACLQVMAEFGGDDLPVLLCGPSGPVTVRHLGELMPSLFRFPAAPGGDGSGS
jgi:cytidine deaminase